MASDSVYHPVLLQPVQLLFDPEIPEFRVTSADRPIELNTALFDSIPEIEGHILAGARKELDASEVQVLDEHSVAAFLRGLATRISASGEFINSQRPKLDSRIPQIGAAPVLFLRSRQHGFTEALERALTKADQAEDFSVALARIVGVDEVKAPIDGGEEPTQTQESAVSTTILFSKPTNKEQCRIAEQLDRHSCVLVQGPPGTGKSHTIANLVGHLLANGQSVLVTAHTTKALRVLRGHVVENLRPLCVSVLDNDLDSRRDLESAVAGIVQRLSTADAEQLGREKQALAHQREQLIQRVRHVERTMVDVRWNEFRDVIFDNVRLSPTHAARHVADGEVIHNWLPGPITEGAPLPLSEGEFAELYASNALSQDDEKEIAVELPDLAKLPSVETFSEWCRERTDLAAAPKDTHEQFWSSTLLNVSVDSLLALTEELMHAVRPLASGDLWVRVAAQCAFRGDEELKLWTELGEQIDSLAESATAVASVILDHGPSLPQDVDPDEDGKALLGIAQHLQGGGSLSAAKLLFNPRWNRLVKTSTVNGSSPKHAEHFRALHALLDLESRRQRFRMRWDRQVAALGAAQASELGAAPEQVARQHAARVRQAVACANRLREKLGYLAELGFGWEALLASQSPALGITGELDRLLAVVNESIVEALVARANAAKWADSNQHINGVVKRLELHASAITQRQACVTQMIQAVQLVSAEAYATAHRRLTTLGQAQSTARARAALLKRLSSAAPAWGLAITNRDGLHRNTTAPERITEAWIWRQLKDELTRRDQASLVEVQTELERAQRDLRELTAQLIDRAAWESQSRRTSLTQRQALIGWLDTVRRIGKGTGKRAPKLRREAARLMAQAADAVPVWVMPLSRVVQNFDPAKVRFDVVIIDEASQMDVLGLIALQMAKKVVVVGDHEQVSPIAVGQDQSFVDKLIVEHLTNIPNGHLYDGRQSVYDLARQSFGGVIRLVEHFRCVPDIINFSNMLSYDGEVQPLRDPSASALLPHVVNHFVPGAVADKTNHAEARTVVGLLMAAAEQPEYAGKTFGVVSLVGEEQAAHIDKILRKRMPPREYDHRRIVCGNAAQFQGDERDVMWLSMVDAPKGGPLRLRTEDMYKQRFNVAASRARDQMWVVHSLDPTVDLKPGDLRRRLIDHAINPKALSEAIRRGEERAESEFEKQVQRRLIAAGYDVRNQWRVGHYRIDLVVLDGNQRLAVECDGDRWHTIDNLNEDLARQSTLERLGWRFARIRGTEFFRNPERAMLPVFEKLNSLNMQSRSSDAPASSIRSELRERVVRRAAELLASWPER